MFTGIVQAVGTVRSISRGASGARLVIDAPGLPRPIRDGSSICVSGVCLTVVGSDASRIEFVVVPETLTRSTLASLQAGEHVNLEPGLRAGDPMDGHVVQGHVDGISRLQSRQRGGENGELWTFSAEAGVMPCIIPKGSIAIDGVSLTIARVNENSFSVALIPTTLAQTTLGKLRIGDRVNIETDILARTIIATLQRYGQTRGVQTSGDPLTVDMLRENGW